MERGLISNTAFVNPTVILSSAYAKSGILPSLQFLQFGIAFSFCKFVLCFGVIV